MRKTILSALVLFALAARFPVDSAAIAGDMAKESLTIKTATGEQEFITEIAATKEQQESGLMHREDLQENAGMLFVFPREGKVGMWMKNTLIPLDMLFIDKAGKIIYIAHKTKPDSLEVISAGDKPAKMVLEIKGGVAKEKNIATGDVVIYKDLLGYD